jgi:hypothetical protein
MMPGDSFGPSCGKTLSIIQERDGMVDLHELTEVSITNE